MLPFPVSDARSTCQRLSISLSPTPERSLFSSCVYANIVYYSVLLA